MDPWSCRHYESEQNFIGPRSVGDPDLHRITFCLLGVATPSDLIRDTRTTPFNIGRRIELSDFTEDEAAPLAMGPPILAAYRGEGRKREMAMMGMPTAECQMPN